MKKLVTLFLAVGICCSLVACGGTNNSDNTNNGDSVPSKKNEITLGEIYSVPDYAEFSLVSIETTKKVTASMGDKAYYENDEADKIYIDAVFDITNVSSEDVSSEEFLTATATSESGIEYKCDLYLIEKDNLTWITSYENMAPLSTVRFHAAISVPVSEAKFSLSFDLNGSKFACDYSADSTIKKTVTLNVGDVVGNEEYATIEYIGAQFAERLNPSNTSGAYTYVEVENSDNTYLILEFKLTNYQSNEKDIDTFIGANAKFMDKYKYFGYAVSEDKDQKGVWAYNKVSPLETARAFILIEVPKSIVDKDYSVEVCFDKQFYTING